MSSCPFAGALARRVATEHEPSRDTMLILITALVTTVIRSLLCRSPNSCAHKSCVLLVTVFSTPSWYSDERLWKCERMNRRMNASCAFSATAWAPVQGEPGTHLAGLTPIRPQALLLPKTLTTVSPFQMGAFRLSQESNRWPQPGHFLPPRPGLLSLAGPAPPTLHPRAPCAPGLPSQNPLWFLLEPGFTGHTKQTFNR